MLHKPEAAHLQGRSQLPTCKKKQVLRGPMNFVTFDQHHRCDPFAVICTSRSLLQLQLFFSEILGVVCLNAEIPSFGILKRCLEPL